MSLQLSIQRLLKENTLTDILGGNGKYFKCGCGSILARYSVRRHLRTSRHTNWEKKRDPVPENVEEEKECGICYEPSSEFYSCPACKNDHCMECHSHPDMKRCPFCRNDFPFKIIKPRMDDAAFLEGLVPLINAHRRCRIQERKMISLYRLCRYLIRHRGILHRPFHSRLLTGFRRMLIENIENGFIEGSIFLQQLELD